jgi:CPA2 family monovalent cation:H+ antiporter-2
MHALQDFLGSPAMVLCVAALTRDFLGSLAMVLCVAALTTVLFQRLHQPVVLGYILAGLIIGPHLPVPLVADAEIVHTLSELGVILLMFSLGLEFSVRRLLRVGTTAGVIALVQCSLMMWLGFMAGRLLGWTVRESIFTGAIIAISSTTIIAKAFDEQKIGGKLRELVVAVLVVEDLIAILMMAALTALASGGSVSAGALAATTGRLAAFLVGLVVVGILVVPRTVRAIQKLGQPETTLVACIGFCFCVALGARELGYSVALGAFIAGSLVAESGEGPEIEKLVHPVRDLFAAVFFVSVGMLIDPLLIADHWVAVLALTVLVVVGKIFGVTLGAFLTGNGVRTSVQAGMSLAQIGEFSFIIASLGLALHATREFLYPVAVAVSAVTTLTTPWLIRASGPAAIWVDRKLPRPLQTFAALYGTWLENLRSAGATNTAASRVRRLLLLAFVDAGILAGIVAGTSLWIGGIASSFEERFGIRDSVARVIVILAAIAVAAPFCIGIVRMARKLGVTLAETALPRATGASLDLADALRRALVVTLQLLCVLIVGAPLVAVTQPFMGDFQGAAVLALLLLGLSVGFWRSATNLQAHVRAGAQVIAEVLSSQSRTRSTDVGPAAPTLEAVQTLLPGLGEPVVVRIAADSAVVGKTLAEIKLRGATGATCLAITRGRDGVLVPSARERLQVGDLLALAGTQEAVETARKLLGESQRVAP